MGRTREYVETITDDVTGKTLTADEARDVYLSIGDDLYKLVLSKESADKLGKAIEPFLKNVKPTGWPGQIKGFERLFAQNFWDLKEKAKKALSAKPRPGLRKWAEEEGLLEPGGRGRVPQDIINKYDKAHPDD